MKDISYW